VAQTHALKGVVTVTKGTSGKDGSGNFVATFNLKVDGVNNDTFGLYRAYAHFDNAAQPYPDNTVTTFTNGSVAPMITTFQRNTITSSVTLAPLGNGDYRATVPTANVIDNSTFLFVLTVGGADHEDPAVLEADIIFQNGTPQLRNLVSNTGCASCHGPYPARSEKFPHYAVGGSECQICHSIVGRNIGIISLNSSGVRVESPRRAGTNGVEYFHGIHNSHNMPAENYYRTVSGTGPEDVYSIGYPSDMRNCKVCHETAAQQAAAATAPVSYYLCMSCHQTWDGFTHLHTAADNSYQAEDPIFSSTDFHRTFTMATNCMSCHVELVTMNEAADFHIDFQSTDIHYDSYYGGSDISYDNPDNVLFQVKTIAKSGDNVTFTWRASKKGAAVDPCNDNLSKGPTFRELGAYLAYAKGDDWVNENVSSTQSPGQPASSKNLFTSLKTTCDNTNVATTTGLVVATGAKSYASKAALAIGGKPVNRASFTIGTTPTDKDYYVRVKSPVTAFSMTTGNIITPGPRRFAVNSDKCNGCHRGTLYQHGGDRVDNEQMCVICHNPSANEKNVRAVTYQVLNSDNTVNTSATYDGKVGETYDLRFMLHAIHGAGKRQNPIVIYRSRGIFAFAPAGFAKPTGWPADETTAQPVYGSLNNSKQTHTWTLIHYPRPANECEACHNAEAYEPADQTKAVAVTVDPGTSYSSQADDLVIGPTAGACTGCHRFNQAAGVPIERHTMFDFGYKAVVAKEDMLKKAQAEALSVVLAAP
jgi:OmcA/MtrC family decaheme c-type cytochrome